MGAMIAMFGAVGMFYTLAAVGAGQRIDDAANIIRVSMCVIVAGVFVAAGERRGKVTK